MKERTPCRYCGQPFKARRVEPGRDYFCCTGCALLARVPVDAKGQFPVNAQLVSALALGFLFFNELLCWLSGVLLTARTDGAAAARFLWIAAALALVTWAGVGIIQLRERAARAADVAALALALGAHGWAALREQPPAAWLMAAANAGLIGWSLRGIWRRARLAKRVRPPDATE
ncbi:MAG: hypothetical protein LBI02_03705 [Opitutaceae bacterium]|jgi:hypothetical protein|nr:hypothetical protein [Opitutaceae bacterium]